MEALQHSMGELDPRALNTRRSADRITYRSEFRTRDGYAIEAQVGTVLDGLGFGKEDWERRTEEFSGGWQMRIALAKLLLRKAEPAAAGRADEPSRSGSAQLAGSISDELSVRVRADFARPLFSRRDGE